MKKIAFYSPYLDTAGGGEKYILTAAEILSQKNLVAVLLDDHLNTIGVEKIKNKIENLHDIDFSRINFLKAPIGKESSFLKRLFFLRKFDILFYLTDGSIFFSTAKKNYLHFQVPFQNIAAKSFWGKIKLSSWDLAIYNSNFTKQFVNKEWNIKGQTIYPPVSTSFFKPLKKKKQIISVGRFFGYLKDKKQMILINIFKDMVDENKLSGWSLHLVGAATNGDKDYLDQLEEKGKGYDVMIHPNLPLNELKQVYGESSIYWHASGFQEQDPIKMEHFGISIVEAMASGCIPIVVNQGGAKEIVEDRVNGYLWDELSEFKKYTLELINDPISMEKMSTNAQKRSKNFSKDRFAKGIEKLTER